jgi:hypothetical protein
MPMAGGIGTWSSQQYQGRKKMAKQDYSQYDDTHYWTKDKKKKESKSLLKWREKQKEGAVMKPSTFKDIEAKARASGAKDPKAVAGAAYWNTAESKYKQYLSRKYDKKKRKE